MVHGFYYKASAWVKEDPMIAKLVVRDLAAYLRSTHASHSLPDCFNMISPWVVDRTPGGPKVISGWQKNPEVLQYLAKNGYVPKRGM